MNKTLKIFSIFRNCQLFVEKEKSINLGDIWYHGVYNKQREFVKVKCSEVVKYINNGFFTFGDFKIYLLNHYIFNNKMIWRDIKISDILISKKIYTKKQLDKDKKFILDLNEKVKFKDINTYYKVNADGSNILYDLILKKYITPIFYVRMLAYRTDGEDKYEPSDTLNRVDVITNKIKEIMEE